MSTIQRLLFVGKAHAGPRLCLSQHTWVSGTFISTWIANSP